MAAPTALDRNPMDFAAGAACAFVAMGTAMLVIPAAVVCAGAAVCMVPLLILCRRAERRLTMVKASRSFGDDEPDEAEAEQPGAHRVEDQP